MNKLKLMSCLCIRLIIHCFNARYATSSKRVNVRKLKFDMWKELDTSKIVDSFGTDENLPPQLSVDKSLSQQKHKAKSFQSLIQDINQQPGSYQKDASLPFYFICLLHLANEKVQTVIVASLHYIPYISE